MAINENVNFDLTPLNIAIGASPGAIKKGAEQAFKKIKLTWVADARDAAPNKTGNLQKQINGTSSSKGVMLTNNATHAGFNYSYYQHEVRGNDYLDRSVDVDEAKRILEEEIRRVLLPHWGGGT